MTALPRPIPRSQGELVLVEVSVEKDYMTPTPNLDDIEEWMSDGGAEATDGCWVEPDGVCPHGKPSWLIKLGLI